MSSPTGTSTGGASNTSSSNGSNLLSDDSGSVLANLGLMPKVSYMAESDSFVLHRASGGGDPVLLSSEEFKKIFKLDENPTVAAIEAKEDAEALVLQAQAAVDSALDEITTVNHFQQATTPSTEEPGDFWTDTSTGKLYHKFGDQWVEYGNVPPLPAGVITRVNNVADLKETVGDFDGQVKVLHSYYGDGNGGGGPIFWDADSVEDDNGGTVFQVTGVTTGRWRRPQKGFITTQDFGGHLDGVTNDSSNISNAIDEAVNKQIPLVHNGGTCLISTQIDKILTDNIHIKGNGEFRFGVSSAIKITSDHKVNIEGVKFTSSGDFNGLVINKASSGYVLNCEFDGLSTSASFSGVHNFDVLFNKVSNSRLSGFRFNKQGSIIGDACENVKVAFNTFSSIGATKQAGHGAIMFGADGGTVSHKDITIHRNNAEDVQHIGIGCDGGYEDIHITNNTIIKNDGSGESLAIGGGDGANGVLIEGNKFVKPVADTAANLLLYQKVSDAIVCDNYCVGGGQGIMLHLTGSHSFRNIEIYNNTCDENYQSVLLFAEGGLTGDPATKNVHIGTNFIYSPITTSLERSTVLSDDKLEIGVKPYYVDGKLTDPLTAGWKDSILLGEKNFTTRKDLSDNGNSYGSLSLVNSDAGGGSHSSYIGASTSLSDPLSRFSGLRVDHSNSFGNDGRFILEARYGGTKKDVLRGRITSSGNAILDIYTATYTEPINWDGNFLWVDANKNIRINDSYPGSDVDGNILISNRNGTTANRPASPVIGEQYFDGDLGKPIWYDGTNWIDATGTTV